MFSDHLDYPEPSKQAPLDLVMIIDGELSDDPNDHSIQIVSPVSKKLTPIGIQDLTGILSLKVLDNPEYKDRIGRPDSRVLAYANHQYQREAHRKCLAEKMRPHEDHLVEKITRATEWNPKEDDAPHLHVLINSRGGAMSTNILSCLLQQNVRLLGGKVVTYAVDDMYSAAAHIFATGTERHALHDSTFGWHAPRTHMPVVVFNQNGADRRMATAIRSDDVAVAHESLRSFVRRGATHPDDILKCVDFAEQSGDPNFMITMNGALLAEAGLATAHDGIDTLEEVFVKNTGLDCTVSDHEGAADFWNLRYMQALSRRDFPNVVFVKSGVRAVSARISDEDMAAGAVEHLGALIGGLNPSNFVETGKHLRKNYVKQKEQK